MESIPEIFKGKIVCKCCRRRKNIHLTITEKSTEIILSCGEHSDKSKCGNKIRILLPIHSSIKDLNFFISLPFKENSISKPFF